MARVTDKAVQAKKAAFLAAFAQFGTITHAAKAADIGRQTHYDWVRNDPEYAKAFDDAGDQAIDALEREARRRAIEGTEEPVFHNGKIVDTIRRYSDTLLIFLLKGARPSKYRERVDVTLDVRRAIEKLTDDPAEQAAAIAEAERILAAAKS